MSFLKCCKYTLLAVNTLFALLGLGFMAGGAYVLADGQQYGIPVNFSIGVIVVGVAVFIVTFLAFIGALKNLKVPLWIYIVVLVLLVAAEIAFGVVAYFFTDTLDSTMYSFWTDTTLAEESKSTIQTYYTCCGFYNTTDHPVLPCPDNATDGCYSKLVGMVKQYSTFVYAAGFTLIGVEAVLIILSLVLVCKGGPGGKDIEMDYK